jgi:hypothetical protein
MPQKRLLLVSMMVLTQGYGSLNTKDILSLSDLSSNCSLYKNSKMKINLNAVALTSMDGIGLTSHLEVYNSEVFGNEQLDRDQIRGVEFHDNSPIKDDYGYDEYGGEEYY